MAYVRYIRNYLSGNTVNARNHWVEIKAFDDTGTNIAVNKTVTANFTPSHKPLTALVDNDTNTNNYIDGGTTANFYVQIDLGVSYNIRTITMWHYYNDGRKYHGNILQISEDGVNWQTVFDSNVQGEYAETSTGYTIDVSALESLEYKINIPCSININSNYSLIQGTEDLVPTLTSNTSATPIVVSASSIYNSTYDAWKAFNNTNLNNTDCWITVNGARTGWLKVDLGNPKMVYKYTITSRNDSSASTSSPKDWTFEGSNDNTNWVVLDTRTNETGWIANQKREYVFDNTTAYRYYRINISANVNGYYTAIAEMELMEILFNYDLPSSIYVADRSELLCSIRINPNNRLVAKYDIEPIYIELLPSTIDIEIPSELPCSMSVNPNNRLVGLVDIQPIPIITQNLLPDKDAFIREGVPKLNYGSEQQMLIGYSQDFNERYRSLISFDITQIPQGKNIVSAKLKIYVQENHTNQEIELLKATGKWEELGVTWDNQPDGELLQNYNIDIARGYIEFDVTNLVLDWYNKKIPNFGFILKAVDETIKNIKVFSTKESNINKPILEVQYKDTKVYSYGRNDVQGSMVVVQYANKNISGSLNIREYWKYGFISGSIHVHNQDMVECDITVTMPDLSSSLIVRQEGFSDIPATLLPRLKGLDDLYMFVAVSQPDLDSNIVIRQSDNSQILVDITARQKGDSLLNSYLIITHDTVPSTLDVYYSSDIFASVDVRKEALYNLNSSLVVQQFANKDIPSSMDVDYVSIIPCTLQCLSGYLKASINISYTGKKDVSVALSVNVKWASDLPTTLIVNNFIKKRSYVFIM